MSAIESKFIRWFAGIAGALIIASIIGLVGMYHASGIVSEKVNSNKLKIKEVTVYHEKDVELIRRSMNDIKKDQIIIKNDIKQILKELK
jgi:hypothetical protein